MNSFTVGERVIWRQQLRGEYTSPVTCEIVKFNAFTVYVVRLRVQRKDGSFTEVNVRPRDIEKIPR